MGKRLQPDHPGLARIKQLFEDHLEQLDAEAQKNPAFDRALNTTTFEGDKLQVIGELPSSNGMDKYSCDIQVPPSPERDAFIRQLHEERNR